MPSQRKIPRKKRIRWEQYAIKLNLPPPKKKNGPPSALCSSEVPGPPCSRAWEWPARIRSPHPEASAFRLFFASDGTFWRAKRGKTRPLVQRKHPKKNLRNPEGWGTTKENEGLEGEGKGRGGGREGGRGFAFPSERTLESDKAKSKNKIEKLPSSRCGGRGMNFKWLNKPYRPMDIIFVGDF